MEERSRISVHFLGSMGVYLLRELCGRLTKAIGNSFYGCPSFDQERGVGMLEGMRVVSFGVQLFSHTVYGVGMTVGFGADQIDSGKRPGRKPF